MQSISTADLALLEVSHALLTARDTDPASSDARLAALKAVGATKTASAPASPRKKDEQMSTPVTQLHRGVRRRRAKGGKKGYVMSVYCVVFEVFTKNILFQN